MTTRGIDHLYYWCQPVRLMSALLRSKQQEFNCASFLSPNVRSMSKINCTPWRFLCVRGWQENLSNSMAWRFSPRKRRTYWLYFIYINSLVWTKGFFTPERPVSRSWTLFYSFCLCSRHGQTCCSSSLTVFRFSMKVSLLCVVISFNRSVSSFCDCSKV